MQHNKKITNYGYILNKKILDQNCLIDIRKDLTVKPFVMGNYGKYAKDNSFPLYVENGDLISVPKYYGIEKFGPPEINKLNCYNYPKVDIQYVGQLRINQIKIMNKLIPKFDETNGGILVAGCGIGKTNMAIYLACNKKLKTLFLTHKTFLKNQIIDRIVSTTNISIENIGIIQGKKIKVDCPFVVGMIQSISQIDYDNKIFKDFGMIIIDEVHHMGAKNYSKIYQKISSKYMLGISAEKARNDGLYKIIHWYMGPVLHVEEQKPNSSVIVKKYNFNTKNTEYTKEIVNKYTNEIDRSTMITNLTLNQTRNHFIINLLKCLFKINKNILCLTGRVDQVNVLFDALDNNSTISPDTKNNVGKYLGGMNESELLNSASKKIIIGTYSMAEEGLDIDNLNVVVLCTPKSKIKQSVGRILRKDHQDINPLVIDIADCDVTAFKKQSLTRNCYYNTQNYEIQTYEIFDKHWRLSSTDKKIDNIKNNKYMYNNLIEIDKTINQKSKRKKNQIVESKKIISALKIDINDLQFED